MKRGFIKYNSKSKMRILMVKLALIRKDSKDRKWRKYQKGNNYTITQNKMKKIQKNST